MLTLDQLTAMPPETCFATGEVENSPEGVYMTNSRIGDILIWAAIRGGWNDWVIVCHWKEKGLEYVKNYGDKISSPLYIKKLVPCTEEAFNRYRF